MGVSSLTARDIEHPAPRRQPEHVEETRGLDPVTLERKQRLVLEEILCVEVILPPLHRLRALRHAMKIRLSSTFILAVPPCPTINSSVVATHSSSELVPERS